MRSCCRTMLVCAWVLFSSGFAQSPSDAGARTKILALENLWNNAEKAGDAKALGLLLDDAMDYIDEDGSILTKQQFLEHVKEGTQRVQSLTTDGVSVLIYGDTAVVSGTYWVSGEDRGKPYRRQGRFIDTWILRKGAWVCVTAQATPVLRAKMSSAYALGAGRVTAG